MTNSSKNTLRKDSVGLKKLIAMGFWMAFFGFMVAFSGCSSTTRYDGGNDKKSYEGIFEKGKASYYADKFHGKLTASGVPYDMYALTAAHPTLPFGTVIEVTNLANGLIVVVTVNDRFPGTKGRIIDLSMEAAKRLQMIGAGVADVEIRIVE